MMHLGSTQTLAGGRNRRVPVAERPLERILAIPHTLAIRARLALLAVGPGGEGTVDLRTLMDAKEDAEERDELAAARPSGCWCFGRGGTGERGVLVAGAEVPMVLSVYCKCPDGTERRTRDAEVREMGKAYADQVAIAGLWDGARIPERFNGCTLDTFPSTTPGTARLVQLVREWPDSSEWALVIRGAYGVGKSGLSIGLLRLVAERRKVGLFVKVPDLLSRVRATYGKNADATELELLETLRTVPYLVLDDLGAEKVTDWASSMLFQIIDDRHDNQRKTIITTNLDIPDLGLHLGGRTMHRFDEGTVIVHLDGPNLRQNEKGA